MKVLHVKLRERMKTLSRNSAKRSKYIDCVEGKISHFNFLLRVVNGRDDSRGRLIISDFFTSSNLLYDATFSWIRFALPMDKRAKIRREGLVFDLPPSCMC